MNTREFINTIFSGLRSADVGFRVALCELLAAHKVVITEEVETAGVTTDGRLFISEEFYASLSENAKAGLLAHEMLHLILHHAARGSGKNAALWNVCADMEINEIIRDLGGELPEGAIFPSSFGLASRLLAEEYYEQLAEQAKALDKSLEELAAEMGGDVNGGMSGRESKADGAREGGGKQGAKSAGQDGKESKAKRGKVLDRHGKAVHGENPALGQEAPSDRMRGAVQSALDGCRRASRSGHTLLHRALEMAAGAREIPWWVVLRRYLDAAISRVLKKRYTKPDWRASVDPKVVWVRREPQKAVVGVILDESGSMSDEQVARGLTEVLRIARIAEIYLVRCTTVASEPVKIAKPEDVEFVRKGSGGTLLAKGFEAFEAAQLRPSVYVVFTDCEKVGWPARLPANTVVVRLGSGDDVPPGVLLINQE